MTKPKRERKRPTDDIMLDEHGVPASVGLLTAMSIAGVPFVAGTLGIFGRSMWWALLLPVAVFVFEVWFIRLCSGSELWRQSL